MAREKTVADFPSLQGLIARLIATPTVPGTAEEAQVTAEPTAGRAARIQEFITPEAIEQLTPHAQERLRQRIADAVARIQAPERRAEFQARERLPVTFPGVTAENFLRGLTI
jgi:hypothetical protein